MKRMLISFGRTVRTARNILLSAVIIFAFAHPAAAAVVFEFGLREVPPHALGQVWGVAVSSKGEIFVTDTGAHRIVIFDAAGNPSASFGSEGSGTNQFYYPMAIAAGKSSASSDVRLYIADNGNHRVVITNENGRFLKTFGTYGTGNGQLQNPSGIAVLPNLSGGTSEICAADTRNKRVSCFNEQGQWLKNFTCSDCPGGPFVTPIGIFAQRLENGLARYYVTDNYPGRVVVLNSNGRHVRTIGGPGQSGELAFPDDLVADVDGNIYVTESGFGLERVMKFAPDGELVFSFRDSPYGSLVQPHSIAINPRGDLFVGNFADQAVYKYRNARPRIDVIANPLIEADQWVGGSQAFLRAAYNGVEQVCRVRVSAKITAAGRRWTIQTPARAKLIGSTPVDFALPLTAAQARLLAGALAEGRAVVVEAESAAECPADQTTFTNTSGFRL